MKKNKSIIVLLLILFFNIIIYSTQFSLFDNNTNNVSYGLLLKSNGFYNLTGSPIYIDDTDPNYNWSKTVVDNEWCSGSGTPLDPYIIEDIYINRTGIDTPSITIENSKSYFIIRNCSISHSDGIYLKNVSHGNLIENYFERLHTVPNAYSGEDILIDNCSDINFINNYLMGGWIMVYNSPQCTLENNTIVNSLLWIDESNYISIVNNELSGYGIPGVVTYGDARLVIRSSNNSMISGNSIVIADAIPEYRGILFGGDGNSSSIINNNITLLNGAGYQFGMEITPRYTNIIDNNRLYGCGFLYGADIYTLTEKNIFGTNYVNDRYFYYYLNETNLGSLDFAGAGQVILQNCNNSIIQNQDLTNATRGVTLRNCNDIMINANNLSYNHYSGVYTNGCKNITIISNNASYCVAGISIWSTSLSTIMENNISYTNVGINLRGDNNTIFNNFISNNEKGLYTHYTYNNSITRNEFLGNILAVEASFITGFNFSENIVRHNGNGIYLGGNPIVNNTNFLTNNTIEYNTGYGLKIFRTYDICVVEGNSIRFNTKGLEVISTHNSIIKNNTLQNNQIGLLFSSDDNIITYNKFINNSEYGIFLDFRYWWETHCENNIITDNFFYGCGLGVSERDIDDMTVMNLIDDTNLVNGKPLRFFVNETGVGSIIDVSLAGQIVLINCTDTYLEVMDVSNSSIGISMSYCDDARIWKMNCTYNKLHGIYLYKCDNISISDSIVSHNNKAGIHVNEGSNINASENIIYSNNEGIYLYKSSYNLFKSNEIFDNFNTGINITTTASKNNTIYMNHFNNPNNINAIDNGVNNEWDNGSIGNEWQDYDGFDCDGDGIGETPYINGNIYDEFPICDTLDTFDPIISITSLQDNQEIREDSPALTMTIDDYILHSYWYTLDGGNHNFTFYGDVSEVDIQIDQSFWDTLDNGEHILEVYAMDIVGNIGYSMVRIIKNVPQDTSQPPFITIILTVSIIGAASIASIIIFKKYKQKRE